MRWPVTALSGCSHRTLRSSLRGSVHSKFCIAVRHIIPALADTASIIAANFIGAIAGMTQPTLQSLMSLNVDADAQGELQGAIASMLSLTAIIGPLMMTQTSGSFADDKGLQFPGAPFFISLI